MKQGTGELVCGGGVDPDIVIDQEPFAKIVGSLVSNSHIDLAQSLFYKRFN